MLTDWYEIAQDRKAWYDSCTANLSQRRNNRLLKEQEKRKQERNNYYDTSTQHVIVC